MFEIMNVEGTQTVTDIKIKNLTIDDGNYSPIAYNIDIATKDNIVYPPKDPSVFEVKYPNTDIKGIVVWFLKDIIPVSNIENIDNPIFI